MAEIKKPDAETRRQRLIAIGTALHGPLFGKLLAAGIGVSQQLISHIVGGHRGVTDELERKLVAYAVEQLDRRQMEILQARDQIRAIRLEHGETIEVAISPATLPTGETVKPPRAIKKMVMPVLGPRRVPSSPGPEIDDEPEFKP